MSVYFAVADYDDFIMHFRVGGEKNGRRRWQNKDGSLTPAGRIHYGVGPPREKKKANENENNSSEKGKGKGESSGSSGGNNYKDEIDRWDAETKLIKSKNAYNDEIKKLMNSVDDGNDPVKSETERLDAKTKLLKAQNAYAEEVNKLAESAGSGKNLVSAMFDQNIKNGDKPKISNAQRIMGDVDKAFQQVGKGYVAYNKLKDMTKEPDPIPYDDDELRKRISRIQLEKQYRSLTADDTKSGEARAKEIIEIAGAAVAVVATAAGVASTIYEIKKGLS